MKQQTLRKLKNHPDYKAIEQIAQRYAVGVSDHVLGTMHSRDPERDPIARQYIPMEAELTTNAHERSDPVGDDTHSPVKGIVHRYADRALFKVTSICPIYCRYCFRKTMVGPQGEALKKADEALALDYLARTTSLSEVILTGGDPLMLAPHRLRRIMETISAMDHIKTLRIHSRVPIADPDRVSDDVLSALALRDPLYIVVHVNHAQELASEKVQTALKRLRRGGAILLSQSVLLRGVNDDARALTDLFKRLVELGVKPYMLHQLDPAPGTQHFRVPIEEGQDLMRALRGHISGLCLPEYILDIPAGHGKIPLTPSYYEDGECWDYKGQKQSYE